MRTHNVADHTRRRVLNTSSREHIESSKMFVIQGRNTTNEDSGCRTKDETSVVYEAEEKCNLA